MDRAGRLVDHIVDQCQLALGQLFFAVAARGADDKRGFLVVFLDIVEGFLRQSEADKDRLQLGDHDQRRVVIRMHEIADIDQLCAQTTVDRRADIGIAEVKFGIRDLRCITLDRGLKLLDRRLLLVVALLCLPSGSKKFLIPFEVELGAGQLRLVLFLGCLRRLKRRLIGARIDLE